MLCMTFNASNPWVDVLLLWSVLVSPTRTLSVRIPCQMPSVVGLVLTALRPRRTGTCSRILNWRTSGMSTVKRPPEPWHSFLRELDEAVDDIVRLACIGGFVVTQLYGLERPTAD